MKRSEINHLISESIEFFHKRSFTLPPWGYWRPEDWKGKNDSCSEIIENMLGYDLTDFGSHNFHRRDLIRFTLRNGNQNITGKLMPKRL